MEISALFIYPIKSLGGVALRETMVESRGFEHDRRWVLADENNRFLSQRENNAMALIDVALEADGLLITDRKQKLAPILIQFQPQTTEQQLITVWDDAVQATRVSDAADAWFTSVLEQSARLFYQQDASIRLVDQNYATETDHTSFSDGYPILIAGEASLALLNEQCPEAIEMKRFRPNIVIKNTLPHEEDSLSIIEINDVVLEGVKPCARCVMTTINPITAEKTKEPLKTLMSYRKWNNKILFGENLLVKKGGKISVGDSIEVVSRKATKL